MDKIVPIDEEFVYEGKVAISQTDVEGKITFVNRKFCEISGYTVNELINNTHNLIRHPDVPDTIFQNILTTLKNAQVWNGMIKNLHKDGRYYWVDMEIAPIRNSDNDITGYISVCKPSQRKNIADTQELYSKQENAG